jgi:L-alanine-DL-glutamate epimerase-like enolase superfamily enzyme
VSVEPQVGGGDPRVERIDVSAYTIPTETPESDGTLEWDATTLVLVEVRGGGHAGVGFSYAAAATAQLIRDLLADVVTGRELMNVAGAWTKMVHAVRNVGRPGIASMGIAAVDTALWDLKAKVLDVPLVTLLGSVRDRVPVYGSGGFTSYTAEQLGDQLAGWVEQGIPRVKMKVGRSPGEDVARVRAAREAIGMGCELFVDANGAYTRMQAAAFADAFAEFGVAWFEEPVSSDDLCGLSFLRDRVPAGMEIAAGEYGHDLTYFRRMMEAGAVDVLMPDATRCAGISGFLEAGVLCRAFGIPLSAHTAPALHLHPCCAVASVRHLEYFHDHVRIEHLLFDGVQLPVNGVLRPDRSRPGLGLEFKRVDADRWKVAGS